MYHPQNIIQNKSVTIVLASIKHAAEPIINLHGFELGNGLLATIPITQVIKEKKTNYTLIKCKTFEGCHHKYKSNTQKKCLIKL